MKELIEETLKKLYEEAVRKDMMKMGFEEPKVTYLGYDDEWDPPVLSGWVVANNYENEVHLDLEGGELYYSGCCGILNYL